MGVLSKRLTYSLTGAKVFIALLGSEMGVLSKRLTYSLTGAEILRVEMKTRSFRLDSHNFYFVPLGSCLFRSPTLYVSRPADGFPCHHHWLPVCIPALLSVLGLSLTFGLCDSMARDLALTPARILLSRVRVRRPLLASWLDEVSKTA
ncbi:hypothetical protein PoB_000364600 [Plakobranchus ocellatus]|uniref:Uncharacterized protein n=1 Tax=Plakobranchus ocellatus TaxID=259542 RepID=A0AAV3Y403_9GAST|nr:hypothetical protein PoB_000364600 [Plakobranchus ocellatus]